jgi:rRNA maturation protein Nop10
MNCIKRCAACKQYTLDKTHCGITALAIHPPKFKIEDRYAKYRRQALFSKS